MSTDHAKLMSQKSDRELTRIVTINNGNEPQVVVDAAQAELTKRNIDPVKMEALKAEVSAIISTAEKMNYTLADISQRYLHVTVDGFIILGLFWVLAFMIVPFAGVLAIPVIAPVAYFGYYVLMEYYYQKTIGKFITHTKVVTVYGEKCDLKTIFQRTLCRLTSFDKYSYFINNGVIYHDDISDTVVIADKEPEKKN